MTRAAVLSAALLASACMRSLPVGEQEPAGDGAAETGGDAAPPLEGPAPQLGPCPALGLAVGLAHSCALSRSGEVWCWGAGVDGQLGIGPRPAGTVMPARVHLPPAATRIAAGNRHTCALDLEGRVWCWGSNDTGQLGDPSMARRDVPTPVDGAGIGNVALAAGEGHTCALHADGGLQCWGANTDGQLGIGDTSPIVARPSRVTALKEMPIELAAGGRQTCVRTRERGVICWGARPDRTASLPEPVAGPPPGAELAQIAVGGAHACALMADHALFCWGSDASGELGRGAPGPPALAAEKVPIEGVRRIAAGPGVTCVMTLVEGDLRCWGLNDHGQLGAGPLGPPSSKPILVPEVKDPADVAVGREHACARTGEGRILCWGSAQEGQLATPPGPDRPRPEPVCPLGLGASIP